MIAVRDLVAELRVALPPVVMSKRDGFGEVSCFLREVLAGNAECSVVVERAEVVKWARLRIDGRVVELCLARQFVSSGGALELHAPNAAVVGEELDLGSNAVWKSHPDLTAALHPSYARVVMDSWGDGPIFVKEKTNSRGELVSKGLRPPQVGALHALAAHWSVKNSHAKIVLPTGTGKTDVMIAATLMAQAGRTLVLVPSDALRTQISQKFASLGVLEAVGAVPENALRPIIGKLKKCPKSTQDAELIKRANVVVTTTQMLLGMESSLLSEFLSWYDLVMFDEAHHLPAASWARINDRISHRSRIVSVTATPYRNDGKRVPGELVYQFPLRMAQEQGYFTEISVHQVEEGDPARADYEIAKAAVAALTRDQEIGQSHLILARARSLDHANALHAIYSSEFPELNPAILHSGITVDRRRQAVDGLRELRHRVVVCVDMLGEGFDLPALKIAAMHELHKSLPITLQFIGRFTRNAEAVGSATVVINMAEPMAETAVAELFSEDADWNDLVPELSARAIRSEVDVQSFVETMRASVNPEDKKFDLSLLTPKLSVAMYTAGRFHPESLSRGLPKTSVIHQSWISEDRDIVVFVTQDWIFPDWSLSKDAAGYEWNMGIVAFDSEAGLLYVNSTHRSSRLSALARAVGGSDAMLLSGEKMFRVFDGLHRAVLHNVGLYRRGQVRFQMLAGMDIGGQVSNAVQTGSSKSNLFAVGYEDGKKTNVGASFKGRVWSMSPTSIPDWLAWSKRISRKVIDNGIATNSFLQFTLIPTEVTTRPDVDVFACLPPDELLPGDLHGERRISVYGSSTSYTQVDLSFDKPVLGDGSVTIEISVGEEGSSTFRLEWLEEGFRVSHQDGPRLRLLIDAEEVAMEEYLTSHAPPLLLRDGSELIGKYHFRHPSHSPYTFTGESILPLDWAGVPIEVESKWRAGVQRGRSIQGHVIDLCLLEDNTFVIDDDDSGEAADIIVISDNREAKELEVTLYHCKFSHGSVPGARYADLYEVCGQAVKSSRLLHRAETLLAHIVKREERLAGRPTRFEKGSLREIKSLQKRIGMYRMRLNICIVQPGLSASSLTAELSAVLGAADGFVLEFTGRRLKVFGSQ